MIARPIASKHFYIELCLDEYIANTYFDRPLFYWTRQHWGKYIEPVAYRCLTAGTIPAQVLSLLGLAAEGTYGLSERQNTQFMADHLSGIRQLRHNLSGHGKFRLFILNFLIRKSKARNPLIASLIGSPSETDTLSFDQVMTFAFHLSEHLCPQAIAYYRALRNSAAIANERNAQRTALRQDVRNWNLDSGYALDISFDEQVTLHVLHNWVHFAHLWNNEREPMAQLRGF